MRKRPDLLRKPLPRRADVPLTAVNGRRHSGRAPVIRRLYAEERCNVAELAAWYGLKPFEISYALRNKSSRSSRDLISGAFRRWVAGVGDAQARAAR